MSQRSWVRSVLVGWSWPSAFLICSFGSALASTPAPTCSYEAPAAATVDVNAVTQRIYAYGVQNATSVLFPTWWIAGANPNWLPGINAGNGTWYVDVQLAQFDPGNPHYGSFETDVYLFNDSYTNVWCGGGSWTRASSVMPTSLYVYNYSGTNYNTLDEAEAAVRTAANGAYSTAGLAFPYFTQVSSGAWQFVETLDYRPYGGLNDTAPSAASSTLNAPTATPPSSAAISPPPLQDIVPTVTSTKDSSGTVNTAQPSFKQTVTPGPPPQVPSCTKEGDPCVLANGNQEQTDTDFTYGAITFTRYYNALRMLKPYAGLDYNWSATFGGRVLTSALTDGHGTVPTPTTPTPPFIVVQDERGVADFYKLVPSKSTASMGVYRSTVQKNNVLVVYPNDARYVLFHGEDGHQDWYDQYGRYVRSYYPEDPSKFFNVLYQTTSTDLTLQSNWLISSVEDGRQRFIYFHYAQNVNSGNPYAFLGWISDSYNHALAAYGYDNNFNLASVVHLDTRSRGYIYGQTDHFDDPSMSMPHVLTQVIDENGKDFADFGYDQHGRSVWSYQAGGANYVDMNFADDTSVNATRSSGDKLVYAFQAPSTDQTFRKPNSVTHTGDAAHGVPGYNESWTYGYQDPTCVTQDERVCRHTDSHGVTTEYQYDDLFERVRIEGVGTPEQRRIETDYDESVTYRVTQRRVYALHNGNEVLQSQMSYAYDNAYDANYSVVRGMLLAKCEADPQVAGATAYVCSSTGAAPKGVRRWKYSYCQWNETVNADQLGCPVGDLWLQTVTDPNGNTSTYTYYQTSANSGCLKSSNVLGNCYQDGDLAYVTNALGQKTVTYGRYDYAGRIRVTMDVNNVETDYAYTPRGWVQSTTIVDPSVTPSALTTTYSYDNVGNVLSVTDPDHVKVSFTYDDAHRLTDITDALGNHVHYTLDSLGNRTHEDTYDPTNTLKHTLSRTYDLLNRLSIATDALSNNTSFTYDDQNRISSTSDPNGITTQRSYDGLNRLKNSIQNFVSGGAQSTTQNVTTQYAYDVNDNLISVTDPDNLTTGYAYDGLNDLTSLSSPDTGSTTYTYDSAGNRLTKLDANNVTTKYGYDALNRLQTISYPTTGLNVTYTYDTAARGCFNTGRLVSITDSTGKTTYCYDRRGNVSKKVQLTKGAPYTTIYTYSPANRLSTISYPSGAVVTYGRDAVGRITSVKYQASTGSSAQTVLSNVSYYPFGPVNVLTFGNGRTLTKTYDQNYAISNVASSDPNGLAIYASVDGVGDLTAATNIPNASTPIRNYTYDPIYRLTGVTDASSNTLEAYTYDATGDRLSSLDQTYNYASPLINHQLQGIGLASRDYDANGNLVDIGSAFRGVGNTVGFAYDDRDRLIGAAPRSGCLACAVVNATYDYNGRGERVTKTVSSTLTQNNLSSTTTTNYAYDESGRLLGEYPGTSNVQKAEYIYLDSTPVAYVTNGVLYYIETDQLGTPRDVVQPGATTANDAVVWTWDYFGNSFGQDLPDQDPGGNGNSFVFNLRFPGQYFDQETGLHYNYFRDYEPGTGRYVESDPIGLKGGLVTYNYVMQNPMRLVDSTGQNALSIPWEPAIEWPSILDLCAAAAGPIATAVGVAIPNSTAGSCQDEPNPPPELNCKNNNCPPCSPFGEGTIGYLGPHNDDHFNKVLQQNLNPHLNLFEVNQNKADCRCRWNKSKQDSASPPPDPRWVNLNNGFPPLSP